MLRVVGHVETDASEKEIQINRRNIVSTIVINNDLSEGLHGLDGYSHVFVIYWMHSVPNEDMKALMVRPRGENNTPMVGVFATRGRTHPNNNGLSVARLLQRCGNKLVVQGLDAIHRTPIMDIKPYDRYDIFYKAEVPEWWTRLTEDHKHKHHDD